MEIIYPVIVLPKHDDMVYVYFTERQLKSTTEQLLPTLNNAEMRILDASRQCRKINRVYKVKYLGLWGYNPLLKGRQILVDFEYEPETERVVLTNVIKEIVYRVEKTRHIWESGWDIEVLKRAISNSSSIDEIANLLK